jgi:hypothetical protein
VDGAALHVEWLLQKQFKTPCEYLGEEGARYRKNWGMREPSNTFKDHWARFREEYRDRTLADLEAEIEARREAEPPRPSKRRRRRIAA